MSLVGAVYGALLVNFGKTYFSESFPDLWLLLMAGLFIGVTMAFPDGLAGVWEKKVKPWWARKQTERLAIRAAVARDAATPATPTDDINAPSTVRPLHATPTGQNA